MKKYVHLAIASAGFIGFLPKAPGTIASLATTLVFSIIYYSTYRILPELHVSAVCLIGIIGIITAAEVERQRSDDDPSCVVIDEVAGQLLTFLFLPVNISNLVLGFLAFRIYDIWKPFPVRRMESLKGGIGVMADDMLAGLYANLTLQLINRVLLR